MRHRTMSRHCCSDMERELTRTCDLHPDPLDCADRVINYLPRFNEYGLITHDGGSAHSVINFCPWCGRRLPRSTRDDSPLPEDPPAGA